MESSSHGPTDERPRRWWTALGGTVVFVVLGLALVPGLASRKPASAPEPAPPLEVRSGREAPGGEPAGGVAPMRGAAARSPQAPAARPAPQPFDCMILPNEVIEIGSAITGLIEGIPVERSDYVESGQVVARLESSVERAAVRVAQARADRKVELASTRASLELGEKRRSRARELYAGHTLSLDMREEVETEATLAALALEQARENHRIAHEQLAQARADLERRTIRSPVSGFVVERLMAPGEVVDEQTILRIAEVDPLRVEVILPSHLFSEVRTGARAEIIPEAPHDGARVAEVTLVDRIIDGASGTFGARLILPNPDQELPAGLRCEVRFLEHPDAPPAAGS